MDKEKDMRQILSRETVEVPESLLPENIKKRLMELEQEGAFDAKKKHMAKRNSPVRNSEKGKHTSVPEKGHIFMPYVRACAAVAAGLLICVMSAALDGIQTIVPDPVSVADSVVTDDQNVADGSDEHIYDGYHLAYESLSAWERTIETREKQSGAISNIINGLPFPSKKKEVYYEVAVEENSVGDDYEHYEREEASASGLDQFAEGGSSSSVYSDTNVRTQGVNEGDVVKTDGNYIYEYEPERTLCYIHQVDGATTKCVAKIGEKDFGVSIDLEDMYVSGDRLILLASIDSPSDKEIRKIYKMAGADYSNYHEESWEGYYLYGSPYIEAETQEDVVREDVQKARSSKGKKVRIVTYTIAYIFDISDRTNPKLQRVTFQDGNFVTSRMVGDVLYLFSRRTVSMENMKEDDPKTYIPQINGRCAWTQCVSVPEDVQTSNYSIVSSLDVQTCEDIDEVSVLGGSSKVYVSGDHIYTLDEDASRERNGRTVITKFAYADGDITEKATGKVKGFVDDDYALDEYKGYLRVVSTYYSGSDYIERNAVSVLDEDLNIAGSIKNIAKNEQIYSVRFMGDIAYFVTFRQTDPLFTADLSDPENPKIIGELKLPGFSDYLHPVGDHLLLGLGVDGDDYGNIEGLKLSLFDISDPLNVREIHKKVLSGDYETEATANPNALFIDEERGLIGFGADNYGYDAESECYFVFSYDEEKGFETKLQATLAKGYNVIDFEARGLYIDDIFYVVSVGENVIRSYDYQTFERLKTNKDK